MRSDTSNQERYSASSSFSTSINGVPPPFLRRVPQTSMPVQEISAILAKAIVLLDESQAEYYFDEEKSRERHYEEDGSSNQ